MQQLSDTSSVTDVNDETVKSNCQGYFHLLFRLAPAAYFLGIAPSHTVTMVV